MALTNRNWAFIERKIEECLGFSDEHYALAHFAKSKVFEQLRVTFESDGYVAFTFWFHDTYMVGSIESCDNGVCYASVDLANMHAPRIGIEFQ